MKTAIFAILLILVEFYPYQVESSTFNYEGEESNDLYLNSVTPSLSLSKDFFLPKKVSLTENSLSLTGLRGIDNLGFVREGDFVSLYADFEKSIKNFSFKASISSPLDIPFFGGEVKTFEKLDIKNELTHTFAYKFQKDPDLKGHEISVTQSLYAFHNSEINLFAREKPSVSYHGELSYSGNHPWKAKLSFDMSELLLSTQSQSTDSFGVEIGREGLFRGNSWETNISVAMSNLLPQSNAEYLDITANVSFSISYCRFFKSCKK